MPNYVRNRLSFAGPKNDIQKMLETIKNDELGIGTIDFNKIIPMPEELMIECGSRTTNGLKAVDQYIKDNRLNDYLCKARIDELQDILNKHSAELPETEQDTWDIGVKSAVNIVKFGYPNWYDWSVDTWGTKWNACGYSEGIDYSEFEHFEFDTAWSAPVPVLTKLSEMFPKIDIHHKWADEDFGQNVGDVMYRNGKIYMDLTPSSSKECLELASDVWEYDLEELGYFPNKNGDGYVFTERDDFELVELFGQDALFTNERLNESEVPEGLYLYHIRMTDDGEQFGAIEESVTVNHGGSVITKQPIELGESGYIDFNEENSPNFTGNDISMHEYIDDQYTVNEDIGQAMS
jgi:hypothetical protein